MMSRRSSLAVVVLLGCLVAPVSAQSLPGRELAQEQAAAVDQAVSAELHRQGIVGAAIGIIRDGEIVYLKGYGLADRETGAPVTTQTVFNWASNSKPLAAVAAMQLVERNQLELETDVRRHVPEFPDKGVTITVRHLLTHQSGIPHYSNGKIVPNLRTYSTPRPFLDPVLAVDVFSQSPLLFKPGEKTSYSSYAYILLSAVLQRAGQEPFLEQIERRIARPLNLQSLQLDVETDHQPHWAAGYIKDRAGNVIRAEEQANYWKHGAGGYKSNIQDFARWAQALTNRRLLTEAGERAMWSVQTTSGGDKTRWGLGFTVEDQGGLKVSHNGKQDETTTRLVIYPRARHGVVVMCNCGFAAVGDVSTAVYRALDSK